MKEPHEYLELYLNKPIEASLTALDNVQKEVDTVGKSIPNSLQMFPSYLKSLEALKGKINGINFEVSKETLTQFVLSLMEVEMADAMDVFDQKTTEVVSKVNAIIDSVN